MAKRKQTRRSAKLPQDLISEAEIPAKTQEVEAAYRQRSARDPLLFIYGLTIPGDTGPRPLSECLADFQRECFEDIAPSLVAIQQGKLPPKQRFWIERTKKASKDGDIAAMLLWLVLYAQRPLLIQVGAADKDQAAIVRRRMENLLHYNDWLNEHITIQAYKVFNKKTGWASIEIVAADIGGSHGETPDVLVVNELSHVTKWEFVQNLLDNADGVPQGLVIVATNAGIKGSPAEALRKVCLTDPAWTAHILDRPAPWHSEQVLKTARKRNTLGRYNRLWRGKWASGKGDALAEDDIDKLFHKGLRMGIKAEPGWRFAMGLDLGISNDHAGVVVLGANQAQQRLRIFAAQGFEPLEATGEVDLMTVEEQVLAWAKAFRADWVGYDPYQAVLMAQRLRTKRVRMYPMTFTPANLSAMAAALKTVVENSQLECYPDIEDRLRRDLGRMSIAEKSYGLRLEATRDSNGHADVGTALCICLPRGLEMLAGAGPMLDPDDELACTDHTPLTEEELQAVPADLADIMESSGLDPTRRAVKPKRTQPQLDGPRGMEGW